MKIAIVSDTHSRTLAIGTALDLIAPHGVELILHCGDIEDDEAVLLFPAYTHFVLGNCDHDSTAIRRAVQKIGATMHEPFGHLELAGKNIAFLHGDDRRLLLDLENADAFDFIFHGHTHEAGERRTGKTRVINPGALHRARPKTFAILDLASGEIKSLVVE